MGGTSPRTWVLRMAGRLWWSPLVLAGVLLDHGSRVRWLLTPAIVVAAASASTAGKLVIRRSRPGASTRIAPLGRLGAAGFPSTHAACAFAIAGWHRDSRQRGWLHLVAFGIGYLRVRRRAHYYGDVVGGAILGYGLARQAEGAWSRIVLSRAGRFGGRAGEHRATRQLAPRTVEGSASLHRSPPRRGAISAPAGHQASNRPSRGRNGAGAPREHLGAKVSALEVS